jgi:HSP20 family protein
MLTLWNTARSTRTPYGNGSVVAFRDLRREMDRLFDDLDRSWIVERRSSAPEVELHETEKALGVRVDLPGLTEDDVQITLDKGSLTLRAQRAPRVPEGYSVHRQERHPFSFARTLALPCRIDADGVQATMKDGVLHLVLPKAPEDQPRTVRVTAS